MNRFVCVTFNKAHDTETDKDVCSVSVYFEDEAKQVSFVCGSDRPDSETVAIALRNMSDALLQPSPIPVEGALNGAS